MDGWMGGCVDGWMGGWGDGIGRRVQCELVYAIVCSGKVCRWMDGEGGGEMGGGRESVFTYVSCQ